jgi:AcrR family transcriptional regulator
MSVRRPPHRTPRQEEIVDAAIALVREGGWPHLTVRRLAKRLGVTDPALYRHFSGKGELALAIADRMLALLLGPVRAIAAEPATPPRRKIERIVAHHVELLLATDGLPMLLMAEAATGDERLAARLRQVMGEYLATLTGLVAALPRRERSVRPEEIVLQLVGLPAIVALQRRLMPDRRIADARIRRTLARHLRQVLPPEPRKRREEESA